MSLDPVLDRLQELLDSHPRAASAALLAFAVERDVVKDAAAKRWAREWDLEDFDRVKALLAREVEKAGRKKELVALLQAGRRLQRRTGAYLEAASG